jgi:hypothetical protein
MLNETKEMEDAQVKCEDKIEVDAKGIGSEDCD